MFFLPPIVASLSSIVTSSLPPVVYCLPAPIDRAGQNLLSRGCCKKIIFLSEEYKGTFETEYRTMTYPWPGGEEFFLIPWPIQGQYKDKEFLESFFTFFETGYFFR